MKFGLSDKDYRLLESLVLAPIKLSGGRVFVFGSRTSSTHHPYSDIDLLVEWPADKTESRHVLAKARDDIEESNFPIKVDLVLMQDLATSYLPSVLAERVEI